MKTNRKILVVDDDPVVGRSFERVLSSKGYAVINCHSGEEALAKLQKEEYDAVFTDLKMPDMDGIQVAEHVKASQPWMPVVIVTGYATKDAQQRAAKVGVTNFVEKPLNPEAIEHMAASAMLEKEAVVESVEKPTHHVVNIALFLVSPFIGLLYALALPFVGMYLLAKAALQIPKFRKALLLIASPFIGLAFALGLPIFGIPAIAYYGAKSAFK